VRAKIAAHGIQVDNLCTFLPQDRVGDFSGFDPKAMLLETCKAVDEKALHRPLEQLMELSKSVNNGSGEASRVSRRARGVRQRRLLCVHVC
jgi:structural maintenance of chromosomes protein 5